MNEQANILDQYVKFVDGVTSEPSKNIDLYIESIRRLREQGCDIVRLDLAFTGICGEGGEANDLVKKLRFHGKDWTPEIEQHLAKELGDIMWYAIQGCIALGVTPQDVIKENVRKLEARYPGGKFSAERAEHREKGDI